MYSGKQKSGTEKKKQIYFYLERQSESAGWE